jgi:hypothetical protein
LFLESCVASPPASLSGPSWVVERDQYGYLTVRVTDQAALDTLLKSKFFAMKDALRAGDTQKASSYYVKRKLAQYKDIMDNLTIPYNQIDSYFNNIVWKEQRGPIVEYRLTGGIKGGAVMFELEKDNQ